MKNKGFTLVELLAVILILGIITLIAIPIVTSVVEVANRGAAEQSAMAYINAVNQQIVRSDLTNHDNKIKDDNYTVGELNRLGVEVKGTIPEDNSKITIIKGEVKECELFLSGYAFICNGEKLNIIKLEKESPKINIIIEGKFATITITDNQGVTNYAINKDSSYPNNWVELDNTKKYETLYTAEEPGTFYIHAKDYSGNTSMKEFIISSNAFNYEATKTTTTYEAYKSCSRGSLSGNTCSYIDTCSKRVCDQYDYATYSCAANGSTCTTVNTGSPCCPPGGGTVINRWTTTANCRNENYSCSKTDASYLKYRCETGDNLSGTICIHEIYSCPDGGTLSGTICVR